MDCVSVTIPFKEDALRLCGDKVDNVTKVGTQAYVICNPRRLRRAFEEPYMRVKLD